jgi:hypothetical protein
MNLLIKYIILNNYNDMIMSLKTCNKQDIINIYLFMLNLAINNKTNDKMLFTITLIVYNYGINIFEISSVYYMLYILNILQKNNYVISRSYILKLLIYHTQDQHLKNIIEIFKKSPMISHKFTINNINKILDIFVHYMSAHKIYSYGNQLYPIISVDTEKIQEKELFERLFILTKMISLIVLKYFGVNIISIKKYNIMHISEKFDYYSSCINTINISLKKIIMQVTLYYDLKIELDDYNNKIKNIL